MNLEAFDSITNELKQYNAKLVAVSKTKPNSQIQGFYDKGQRIFGENKVQELGEKYEDLPKDIEWHFIGHLQRNKVKYIAPYVSLLHGVDSLRLLKEVDKQAKRVDRNIDVLCQMHIAQEETKFGLDNNELFELLDYVKDQKDFNVNVVGLMGMATNTDNTNQVAKEFKGLQVLFNDVKEKYFLNNSSFKELSMGMSGDYKIALDHGSTLVRIGSTLFGNRNY